MSLCSSWLRLHAFEFVTGFALSEIEPAYALHAVRTLLMNKDRLLRFDCLYFDADLPEIDLEMADQFLARFAAVVGPRLRRFGIIRNPYRPSYLSEARHCFQPSRIRSLRLPGEPFSALKDLFLQNSFPELEELEIAAPENLFPVSPEIRTELVELLGLIASRIGGLRVLHLNLSEISDELPMLAEAIRGVVAANPRMARCNIYSQNVVALVKNVLFDRVGLDWASLNQVCRRQLGLGLSQVSFHPRSLFNIFCGDKNNISVAPVRFAAVWNAYFPAGSASALERIAAFSALSSLRLRSADMDNAILCRFEEAYSQLDPAERNYPQVIRALVALCTCQWFTNARTVINTFLKRLAEVLLTVRNDRLAYLIDCCSAISPHLDLTFIRTLIQSGYLGNAVRLDTDLFVPKLLQRTMGFPFLLTLLNCPNIAPEYTKKDASDLPKIEWMIEHHPEWACEQILLSYCFCSSKGSGTWFSQRDVAYHLLKQIVPVFGCCRLRQVAVTPLGDDEGTLATCALKFASLLWKVWEEEKATLPGVTRERLVLAFGEPGDATLGLKAITTL